MKIKVDPDSVKDFKKFLGKLGDIYVNDAFGAVHRADASIAGVNIPVRAAGYLVKKELDYFKKALQTPQRPFLGI
jgi:phosphoglycerate kinase